MKLPLGIYSMAFYQRQMTQKLTHNYSLTGTTMACFYVISE